MRVIEKTLNCWICDSNDLEVVKHSNVSEITSEQDYSLVNFDYGLTGELHGCKKCGFVQWSYFDHSLELYERLEDREFELIKKARTIQQKKVLLEIKKYKSTGKLLDVGAGNGLLIKEATKLGYEAEGIEPSEWFYKKAKEKGLQIYNGTLPHPDIKRLYDIVTIIDTLEHIPYPVNTLKEVRKVLKDDGIAVVIVPDIECLAAKVLKWKWWNYKPGHIAYFNKKTLELAFNKAGFKLISQKYRPEVYYPSDFVLNRIVSYFPRPFRFKAPSFLKQVIIPLDLKDSVIGFYAPK